MMMKPAVVLQYLRELMGQGAPAELAVLLWSVKDDRVLNHQLDEANACWMKASIVIHVNKIHMLKEKKRENNP